MRSFLGFVPYTLFVLDLFGMGVAHVQCFVGFQSQVVLACFAYWKFFLYRNCWNLAGLRMPEIFAFVIVIFALMRPLQPELEQLLGCLMRYVRLMLWCAMILGIFGQFELFLWLLRTARWLQYCHFSENHFLLLNQTPCIKCSLILRCLSSVRSMPPSSSTIARFASSCRSVRKSSGCSFMGSNFRDCRSSSKILLWSNPA